MYARKCSELKCKPHVNIEIITFRLFTQKGSCALSFTRDPLQIPDVLDPVSPWMQSCKLSASQREDLRNLSEIRSLYRRDWAVDLLASSTTQQPGLCMHYRTAASHGQEAVLLRPLVLAQGSQGLSVIPNAQVGKYRASGYGIYQSKLH